MDGQDRLEGTLGRTSLVMFLSVVRIWLIYSPRLYRWLRPLRPLEGWIYRKLRAAAAAAEAGLIKEFKSLGVYGRPDTCTRASRSRWRLFSSQALRLCSSFPHVNHADDATSSTLNTPMTCSTITGVW